MFSKQYWKYYEVYLIAYTGGLLEGAYSSNNLLFAAITGIFIIMWCILFVECKGADKNG
jgi:hypothetical protein